jgi:muramidase (phage lysozyme)
MAHGYLSYQDNRGNVDYLGKIVGAIRDFLEKEDDKRKTADMVAVKVNVLNEQQNISGGKTNLWSGGGGAGGGSGGGFNGGGKTNLWSGGGNTNVAEIPLQKMLGGSSLQRSLPGASAVNPDVVGDAATPGVSRRRGITGEGYFGDSIVDIGATNLGVVRDLGGGDMFTKRLDTFGDSGGGSEEVVQAIDRLTFVTMSLVSATKEQSNQQKMIAGAQRQQTDKLARKSKAAAEESALEKGQDLSGNSAYQGLLRAATGAMSGAGGSRRGGGPGMGLGGKVLAKNMLKGAAKRGSGRTGARLGIAIGGKLAGGFGARMGAKLGAQTVGKVAGGALAKSLGKKIPLVGLGLGAVFAAQRAMQGDFLGAGLELASGAASTVPGIGTAGSVGIDAALAARDMGVVPFADGGIISDATLGLVGEKGKEGVFPLEGAEGRKTFLMFGEGILDAQFKNKSKFAKLQAQGLSQYYDKQNGWGKFIDALSEILPDWLKGGRDKDRDKDRRRNDGGAGDVDAATIKADTPAKKALIATVREAEGTAGKQGYNTVYGGAVVPELTQMTLGELYEASKLGGTDRLPERLGGGVIPYKKDKHNSSASGAPQLMPETLKGLLKSGQFTPDQKFSPETQNAIILALGRGRIGGPITEESVVNNMGELGKEWAGLTRFHNQTDRTEAQSIQSFKKNLAEARKTNPKPDPEVTPTTREEQEALMRIPLTEEENKAYLALDPLDSEGAARLEERIKKRKLKILAKTKEKKAAGDDWAKSLNLGDQPFIDFGSDNQFRAIKNDGGGYKILKKGALGFLTPIDTKGKNLGLKEQLIEAAKPKEVSSLNPVDTDANKLASASTADPNALGIRSQELAMATPTGNTTINNITNIVSDTGVIGGNAPADVSPGLSFQDAMPVLLNAVVV